MQRLILGVMLACAVMSAVSAGPLEDGIAALNRRDYSTAMQLLRPLADQGNAVAQYQIGLVYFHGTGVPQNYPEAMKWLRKPADQDHADAQHALGIMYNQGYSVPQDNSEAVKWYRKAAAQGHALSQTSLGLMYYKGDGVPQDLAAALHWTRMAAEQGNADGQSNLGVMYAEGKGVPQDAVEAAKWYYKAAVQGQAMAQSNLAHMYVRGLGVPQDYVEAYRWWSLAAARFSSSQSETRSVALSNRDRVASQMTPAQIIEAQRLVRTWNAMFSIDDETAESKERTPVVRRQDVKDLLRKDPRFQNAFAPSAAPNQDQRVRAVIANCSADSVVELIFGPHTDEIDRPTLRARSKQFAAMTKDNPTHKQGIQATLKCVLDSGILIQ